MFCEKEQERKITRNAVFHVHLRLCSPRRQMPAYDMGCSRCRTYGNCIAPGTMDTARAAGRAARPAPTGIPLGRYGDAEEIATTVRFLCGPGASYISGQSLQVNGGQMMF